MQISENGLAMIRQFEGCRLDAYQDGGGCWTIGYGHTATACEGACWTKEQADAALAGDAAAIAERPINAMVKVPLSQNQFDALCSFVYNLGSGNLLKSTLLKLLNERDYAGAQAQFADWNLIAGKASAGLARRRAAEAELFGTPDTPLNSDVVT